MNVRWTSPIGPFLCFATMNVASPSRLSLSSSSSKFKDSQKDVVAFLAWAAEPHLEARHKIGFRAIIYLFIITVLVYFSMKKLWSRIESKV